MELNLKEKNLKILEQMKPIDDIFFEVLANTDIEYILKIKSDMIKNGQL